MNERKLLIDTDTRHTTSSALQHSESFTSLTPFVGKIKIEHFSFLRWLVNFDNHCICFWRHLTKQMKQHSMVSLIKDQIRRKNKLIEQIFQ